jgi:predicted  nucleic acid-binding Zn-ribbon protein
MSVKKHPATAREVAAQMRCLPQHVNKVMDPDLSETIAQEIARRDREIDTLRAKMARLQDELDAVQNQLMRSREEVCRYTRKCPDYETDGDYAARKALEVKK